MKKNHVSFDVFDTCLIRRCGLPHKIWDIMADKLFDADDIRGRLSFVGNRQVVEKYANIDHEYPDLNDIYDRLNVSQWGFEKQAVMQLEMEIEEQELFPNFEMLHIVNEYRKKGFQIAFISDMYLPTDFIKKILIKYGFCREDESVYVSAACKAGKFNGKLYDYALKKSSTTARSWIHYGDNLVSDVYIPRAKRITSYHVRQCSLSKEEERWYDEAKFYSHKNEIELWSGLCRFVRSRLPASPEYTLAVDFIGSVYVPYVIYVLRTAKNNGVSCLYFLGRDGRIFLEIAKSLISEGDGIELRYLKVSRKVLYQCVFYELNDFEFSISVIKNKSVSQNLEYIGIAYDELSAEIRKKFKSDYLLNSDGKTEKFCHYLKMYDGEKIKKKSSERRRLFLNYLNQEKFFDNKNALVDLGWVGTSRCAFNYVLKKEGASATPMFYWGANRELLYGQKDDSLFVFNKNIDFGKEFTCANLFLEQYASMNEDGSCVGYKEVNGKIVVLEKKKNESIKEIVNINENAVKTFAKSLDTFGSLRFGLEALYDIFLCCGAKRMQNLLRNPEKDAARILGKIKVEDYGVVTQLNSCLSIKDILALLVWGIPISFCWLELSLRKTFGPFAPLFKAIYKKTSRSIFARWLIVWWERRKNKV